MTKPKSHVAKWKKEEVKKLEDLISRFKIIGIADLTSVPSAPLQKMKSKIKDNTKIKLIRINLLKLALENLKSKYPNLEQLSPQMRGMVALILTNDNPFKLAKSLNESKSPAPAKPGNIAPNDIKIPAGPTPFAPGPIIGELGQLGIKTSVEAGKVVVKEDTVIVKKGESISRNVVTVLTRLDIQPMEIGINLISAYENGTIFNADVLSIDEKEFNKKLNTAISDAFKLAYSIKYPTKENIKMFLQEAHTQATALADSQNIMTNENLGKILAKAEVEAKSLKSKLPNIPESKSDEEVAQEVLKKLQDKKLEEGKT